MTDRRMKHLGRGRRLGRLTRAWRLFIRLLRNPVLLER